MTRSCGHKIARQCKSQSPGNPGFLTKTEACTGLAKNTFIKIRVSLKNTTVAFTRAKSTLVLLRSEIPSSMRAKLPTVAASNNRDHACNLSSRTLVIMFNRSHVNIGRATKSQSLLLLLARATYIMVLFFTHIPFMVNHTINATPPERLQQYQTCTGVACINCWEHVYIEHLLLTAIVCHATDLFCNKHIEHNKHEAWNK